ncbi:MAG: hypothetical protein WAW36_10380 [Methylovulum miyakonense]|uniref:hypothetical protein n=1 Tax=Methylovulum miyakonense TaxID=645578 RepID=UPI003BB63581
MQSNTTLAKLEKSKFGARDKQGKVFKWLAYGNLHHVEILRDRQTSKYSGEFVTMMEASHRAKGIGKAKQPIVKTDHGATVEFVMALHINDIVSVENDGRREFYRVQNLDSHNKRMQLRLHTAASAKTQDKAKDKARDQATTLPDKDSTIPALMASGLQKHKLNILGKVIA